MYIVFGSFFVVASKGVSDNDVGANRQTNKEIDKQIGQGRSGANRS